MIFAIILFLGGSIIALSDWRRGISVVVLAGFLQDPIRKLVEGQPVIFTLIAPALFGVCFLSAMLAGEDLGVRQLNRFSPVLFTPAVIFVGWVGFSMLMGIVNTGSLVIAGIGAMAYLAPIPGLILGYRYARKPDDIRNFFILYFFAASLFGISLYLESAGVDWRVLGSVGEGFVFYPESGGITVLRAGLFRSPEVAGWHCAAAICFLVILGISRGVNAKFYLMAALVAAILLPALVLTGRRKFLVEIAMFLGFAFALITYFRTGSGRLAAVYTAVGAAAVIFFFYITSSELPGEWSVYLERSATASTDSGDRFVHMTVGMFQYVIAENGFFGSGAGTGSQGAQHFGGGSVLVGAAAEGGLGKVLAELGVPGLILLVWIMIAAFRYIWAAAKRIRNDETVAPLTYGILAFLAANVVVFTTAHQIFGDVNILLILGLLLGFLMRSPYLLRTQYVEPAPAKKRRLGRRFADRSA